MDPSWDRNHQFSKVFPSQTTFKPGLRRLQQRRVLQRHGVPGHQRGGGVSVFGFETPLKSWCELDENSGKLTKTMENHHVSWENHGKSPFVMWTSPFFNGKTHYNINGHVQQTVSLPEGKNCVFVAEKWWNMVVVYQQTIVKWFTEWSQESQEDKDGWSHGLFGGYILGGSFSIFVYIYICIYSIIHICDYPEIVKIIQNMWRSKIYPSWCFFVNFHMLSTPGWLYIYIQNVYFLI